jgi:hypothetical protein
VCKISLSLHGTLLPPHTDLSPRRGPLILWAIMAISKQREILSGDQTGFESDTKQQTREELMLKAKDLMVFAGLVKLRLAKGVWEGDYRGSRGGWGFN